MNTLPGPREYVNAGLARNDLLSLGDAFHYGVSDLDAEWGAWLEATYDPDNERLEDKEV